MANHLDDRLKERDMGIELTQAAKELLAERGYDASLGARPLRRTIQREVEDALSEKILYNELRAGQIVVVDVAGSGPNATFTLTGTDKVTLPDAPPVETAGTGEAAAEG
jgi:ATP-dependent Clp protease ATP-binding subunit ClpC